MVNNDLLPYSTANGAKKPPLGLWNYSYNLKKGCQNPDGGCKPRPVKAKSPNHFPNV
jgi:hypothetical protein